MEFTESNEFQKQGYHWIQFKNFYNSIRKNIFPKIDPGSCVWDTEKHDISMGLRSSFLKSRVSLNSV